MTAAIPTSMRFSVDGWDPAYGNAFDVDDAVALPESAQRIDAAVETPEEVWTPVAARATGVAPGAVLFVDGVRRIDARVWVDPVTPGEMPHLSICASVGAGAVCCCPGRAHVTTAETRHLLVTTAAHATDLRTRAAAWHVVRVAASPVTLLLPLLGQALRRRLAELEVQTALQARSALTSQSPPHPVACCLIKPTRRLPSTSWPSTARMSTSGVTCRKSHATSYACQCAEHCLGSD